MSDRSVERDGAFKKVEEAYLRFYQTLDRSGVLHYRATKSGMWAVSRSREVYEAFCHFGLGQYAHMADLGSGDGKVALIGSLFIEATGYETDEMLYRKSLAMRGKLNLNRARFLWEDYLLADLSPYDILYLYPDKPFHALEERLRSSWHGHLLVNGPHFPPRQFQKIAECPSFLGRFVLYECGCKD